MTGMYRFKDGGAATAAPRRDRKRPREGRYNDTSQFPPHPKRARPDQVCAFDCSVEVSLMSPRATIDLRRHRRSKNMAGWRVEEDGEKRLREGITRLRRLLTSFLRFQVLDTDRWTDAILP